MTVNASTSPDPAASSTRAGLLLGGFRYATMTLVLFPASYVAVAAGGVYAIGFVWAVVALHCLVDCLTPPLGPGEARAKTMHNAWLFVQLPASVALLLVLLLRASPQGLIDIVGRSLGAPLPIRTAESVRDLLGGVVATAFMLAGNTVVAHEMMHRRSWWARAYAWVLLTLLGDGQFALAHVYGHHVNVATTKDPASARREETVYRFFVRSTLGQYREAIRVDWQRTESKVVRRLLGNRVLMSLAGSAGLLVLVMFTLGARASLALLLVMALSKFLLEAINYIQHFGLVRVWGATIEPRHSWDCHTRAAGTILFGLSFHGHHHAQPTAPLWELRGSTHAPLLPHGYMFALLLALLPPCWFRYIRPRLQHWDTHLANPDERALLGLPETISAGAQAAHGSFETRRSSRCGREESTLWRS